MVCFLGQVEQFDVNGVFFVVGLFGNWVGGVQGDFVDQFVGVEEWYEYQFLGWFVVFVGFDLCVDFVVLVYYFDFVVVVQFELVCIFWVYVDQCVGYCFVQFWDLCGYVFGVLVFEYLVGGELEWVVLVWCFGWWFVGQGEDDCFFVWIVIELYVVVFVYVGVVVFVVVLVGFFVVYYWLVQVVCFVVGVEGGEVVVVVVIEGGVFFEQIFLDIEVECVDFVVGIVFGQVVGWEVVDLVVVEQYVVEGFVFQFGGFCQQFCGLDFVGGEVFGEFYQLLEVGFCFVWCFY